MTVYLCTCGTSAAKNLPSRFNAVWVERCGGIEPATTAVHDSFQVYSMDDDVALKNHLSAEIHSLARMGLSASDTVVLFSSETPDGQVCARALKHYLEQARPSLVCHIKIIPGLQVTNAQRFRTDGVLNFTKEVLHEIDANGPAQCVLNPTGGFKSLVPYTVLIGMIKGVPAKYIFEQSSALIPLPVMPVEFARNRIEPIRPLLERIQQESAIPKADLDAALPFAERAALDPLFEDQGNGQVSLSPVGFLIWEELERPSALVPFLSRRALGDLLEARKVQDCKPDDYIPRVARDRAQLEAAKHISWGHGLFWLKPGDTRDRYLVSVEGWRLLVWRIALHQGEYEILLAQNQSPDAGAGILATRRRHYEPFVRMELYEAC
ncbi:MAG: putative CRISPR-associated protein [Candidatus Contendobacter sp.]|nr:putative CRISPR-associated protein [Candidatus Contendobacter sp.]MDS4059534.1 putative CRISPR-associated protein [Candidatus Contendobacter sp.]